MTINNKDEDEDIDHQPTANNQEHQQVHICHHYFYLDAQNHVSAGLTLWESIV